MSVNDIDNEPGRVGTYKGLLEKMDALLDHTPNLIRY